MVSHYLESGVRWVNFVITGTINDNELRENISNESVIVSLTQKKKERKYRIRLHIFFFSRQNFPLLFIRYYESYIIERILKTFRNR